ncbi:class I SAM-dependent methyltransferase [Pygmaiobacter massiliensis]|uniref:class I SAM-dependent methyltransferase n=1 Tax=Pygmaiobacter massiliensis TaxID=1917873 RepID=UPI000C7CD8DD|nr:class I SAM-dependent methyltransferase [Pygmaiobacter massiliensis]
MNKSEVIAFFDRRAPEWDRHMVRDDGKIAFILDTAGIRPGVTVLDVACGTGVLFEDYLARSAARVTGVDISPAMAHIAATKLHDPRIEVLCGDIETIEIPRRYDCCVVYNAFPHFPDPQRLIMRLAELLAPGGRLTIAHGMSLEALRRHHAGAAQQVSRPMLQPEELAALMRPVLTVDTMISDEEKYVVSAHL